MRKQMRIISIIITFLMSVCMILPINANTSIYEIEIPVETVYSKQYFSSEAVSSMKKLLGVRYDNFKKYLTEEFKKCSPSIDLSSYYLVYTENLSSLLSDFIFNEIPEAFHFKLYQPYVKKTYLSKIEPQYFESMDTAAEYQAAFEKCELAAENILDGISGNDKLSEAEKALLIHDRLALKCEYDFELFDSYYYGTEDSFSMYGALGKGLAVCQGYAEAYDYLLDKVGIESYLCTSDSLFHVWNIVSIDGQLYHVDVTWDDGDYVGSVKHNNFLLSTNALYEGVNDSRGHVALDYDTSPVDTKYDNYYWQNSITAFQLIGDEIYYIDNVNEELRCATDEKLLCSVGDIWHTDTDGSYWMGNFSCLASDGYELFYSDSKNVYIYNLDTDMSSVLFTPDFSFNDKYSIFGMEFSDNYINCYLHNTPNRDLNNLSSTESFYYEPNSYVNNNVLYGDADKSGEINTKDVALIRRYIAGWEIELNTNIADYNRDEKVNTKDVVLIRRSIAGL